MIRITITLFILCIISNNGFSQFKFAINAWTDLEGSIGQKDSNFYYNEIHEDFTNLRLSLHSANILTKVSYRKDFSFNLRVLKGRYSGKKLSSLQYPLLNIKYAPEKKRYAVSIGRFVNPFGNFSKKQHSKKRTFINQPLVYQYFHNISPRAGFIENLGIGGGTVIDNKGRWGSNLIYYGAYSNGILLDIELKEDKLSLSTALTNGSINVLNDIGSLTNFGFAGRLKYRPKYFWEQSFSVNFGTFNQASEQVSSSNSDLDKFTNLMIGTDAEIGFGHWEIIAELIFSTYQVPQFFPDENSFSSDNLDLMAFSSYLNIKYELPQLSGLYLAYGIDSMIFAKEKNSDKEWDDNVLRHNFGLGYKINSFLLLRSNFLIQTVKNQEHWAQDTFRTSLTIHF